MTSTIPRIAQRSSVLARFAIGFASGLALAASPSAAASQVGGAKAGVVVVPTPSVVTQGRVDPQLDVNFTAMVAPRTVYVGQQTTYQIGVFLSDEVRQRLRRNPEFMPSDVRSMLTYDLPTPARGLSRAEGGRRYEVHVFQRALFPLVAGRHSLGAARLTYALPLSNSFFSREENHTARTETFTIVATEPPLAGRPSGYAGAVGRLALDASIDVASGRVGDPVVLTVTVSGVGNVSLFPRPSIAIPWGEAVAGAERVSIDSTSALVQGRKDFEWVVTPKISGDVELPALRYPFFNPYTEQYELALSGPVPLRVSAGSLAAAAVADSTPHLSLRKSYSGPIPEPFSGSPMFWFGLVLAPLPALALGMSRRSRRAMPARGDDRLRRLAAGDATGARELRQAFAKALAERSGVSGSLMADGKSFVRALRRAGVTAETAQRARLVLAELDRAAYGGEGLNEDTGMGARALATYRAIDEEAIPALARGSRPGNPTIVAILVLAFSLGSSVTAMATSFAAREDAAIFDRGVVLYAEGRFDAAAREFGELARRVPRAPDAWANLGTVAWEMRDTATAAVGWQRALRLQPLAQDVRDRLGETPGFRGGLFGDVPPIPLDAAASFGAVAWWGGWLLIALTTGGRQRRWRRFAHAALLLAASTGLGTIALSEVLSGRHHTVVISADRLRVSPVLLSDYSGEVVAGETARTTGDQGVWTRIVLPDGRTGWMERRRLAPLELSRAP